MDHDDKTILLAIVVGALYHFYFHLRNSVTFFSNLAQLLFHVHPPPLFIIFNPPLLRVDVTSYVAGIV